MQAIILAAGMGKRLKELTEDVTKCMVKVNGISIIERMLTQLEHLELSRIIIVVGYKADALKSYLDTLDIKTPILYVENPIYFETNNIYSLYLVREYLRQQDTLLLESDLVFEECIITSLVNDPRPSLALVVKHESWMDGTVVTLKNDCVIDDFIDKEHFRFSDSKNYYKTVNIYKFSRQFSNKQYVPFLEAYCHAMGNNEYYEQVLKVITRLDEPELKAKVLETGHWYEIDDIQDLDIAESIFAPSGNSRLGLMEKRYGGYWRYPGMLDFCYLVNPFFPPQRLLDEIKANFEVLATGYPSGQRVNDFLAARLFGVLPADIVVGNGAAELINSLLRQLPGDIGVVLPTFEEYQERKKGSVIAFKPDNNAFSYSADDLMAFYDQSAITALVVINPDNPSGNYIPHDDVLQLVQWAQEKDVLLVVDESFVDFADKGDTLIEKDILKKHPKLVVIKSLSKAYGIPGFRLGVLACSNQTLTTSIRKDLSIWNINSFAEFYLQISEKYKEDYAHALDNFYPVRDELYAGLSDIEYLRPIPSKANYITCQLSAGYSARGLAESLLVDWNILIKDLSGKNGIHGEYIRVSVKKPEENAKLLEALKAFTH
ncbi:MAG: aminotransferase class I/II-fold pyridoxal phosphate-dependent enzyme [Coriobacteriia bacterium]|nr:aminotransferase class I/II-fold pyridoxal phosphate-dependent enzyme [Coriobacteriia bacterium]